MHKLIFFSTLVVLGVLGTQAVYAQYDPVGPVAVSDTSPEPGDTITVQGSGFDPGSEVKITIESEPVLLATTTANLSGAFSADVTLPTSFQGRHTVKATGIAPDGSVRVLATQITIGAGQLPDTSAIEQPHKGLSDDTLVLGIAAAGVLLVTGTVLFTARRRPHGTA